MKETPAPVIARLKLLIEKLESGEWTFISDSLNITPDKPEQYVIQYDTHSK